jgi:hypothetical protein
MTAKTSAQLKAAFLGQDPRAWAGDLLDSVQNAASPFAGEVQNAVQTLLATGAITLGSGLVILSHATVVIAATKAAPVAGDELFIVNNSASGTAAHTVTFAGATLNGTNTIATLDAPNEALHLIALSATRWFILENIGTVGLSGP